MTNIENEAAPLRKEKREHDHDIIARAFVWAFILLMALSEVTAFVFLVLKVAKIVTWSWPVALIPVWVLLAMSVTAATLLALANKIGQKGNRKCRKCVEQGADHYFDGEGKMVYMCEKCKTGAKD